MTSRGSRPDKAPAAPFWLPAAAALAAFVFFSGALGNGFVNWDDDFTLLLNPHYRGLGWENIRWAFTTFHMGHYQPLSWLSFGLDYLLWGLDPRGYHLTSLLLHAANAALFALVALNLLRRGAAGEGGARLAALFAALFFALHPLRVEAVAWATERRDMLSGFFYLLAVLSYLRAVVPAPGLPARRPVAALLFFVLSLLAKGIGVSLPAALLLLDVWPLRRLPAGGGWFTAEARRVWLEKLPFAALALAAGAVGLFAQVSTGATGFLNVGEAPSAGVRLLQALYGVWFYAQKTLLPSGLLPLYERPFHAGGVPFFLAAGAAGGLLLTAAAWRLRRRFPALTAAWAFYLLTLFPVSQFVPFGPYLAADRYSYLPALGFALLAGLALREALRRFSAGRVLSVAAALALALGLLSARQVRAWKGPAELWRFVLAGNPRSSIAHSNLGSVLLDREGRADEAAEHFRLALEVRPDYPFARYNLGNALAALGRHAEAEEQYRHAIRLMPGYANAWFNLGNALLGRGDAAGAVPLYRRAAALRPDFADAHNNLGTALLRLKDYPAAAAAYREALRQNPGHVLAAGNLAAAEKLAGGAR